MRLQLLIAALLLVCPGVGARAVEDQKPKPIVAVFPIGGDAAEAVRDRTGLAIRAKLDRTEKFEVLDGYKMKDLAAEGKEVVSFETSTEAVKKLAATEKPTVLIWGDLKGTTLRVNILDFREGVEAKPRAISKVVAQPQELRGAIEAILETINDVGKFAQPIDVAVVRDAKSEELWKKNPNLVANGDFSDQGAWHGILESQYYPIKFSKELPEIDHMAIVKVAEGPARKADNVLVMRMSRGVAETNGLACLSDAIKIEAKTRYRLSFKYKSDGPSLHVFVKGYTMDKDIKGQPMLREVYKRQVPPSGATGGKWVEVVDDLNPQYVAFAVQALKVDLYVYLGEGTVMFDDVVLKAVGEQTREAKDKAIKGAGK